MHVIGIAGSLRRQSFNRGLLRAAVELVPDGMLIEPVDLAPVPIFNADLPTPDVVSELRSRIAGADGLLLVTPEYHASVPGVLKNALDWIGRVPASPLDGKPTAILGATPGGLGTSRAQSHLRQIGLATNMLVLAQPELYVSRAKEKFDADGNLIDEKTRVAVGRLLVAFAEWIARLRA